VPNEKVFSVAGLGYGVIALSSRTEAYTQKDFGVGEQLDLRGFCIEFCLFSLQFRFLTVSDSFGKV